MAAQFAEEREEIVMDFLKKQGSIHIGDVTDMLKISPSTARLLLQKMQEKGMLRRTHGGAVRIKTPVVQGIQGTDPGAVPAGMLPSRDATSENGAFVNTEPTEAELAMKIRHHFGRIENMDQKLQIASAAAATVQEGDLISLGSGTTTWLMATMLHGKRDLMVVTDSIPIACELVGDASITLYLCGGWIMPRNRACRGITAESFFQDMKVDKAYNGADSLNVDVGVTSSDYDPRTERAICHSGKECYILVDSSKFSTRAYMDRVLAIDEIQHVISDSALAGGYIDALRRNGVDVILGRQEV